MATDSQQNSRTLLEAAPRAAEPADAWLGPVLVGGGVITPAQLEEFGAEVATLWAAVVGAGWATDDEVAAAVARRFRLPRANLAAAEPRTVTLVPESLARKHPLVPLSVNDRTIQIASAGPRDLDLKCAASSAACWSAKGSQWPKRPTGSTPSR